MPKTIKARIVSDPPEGALIALLTKAAPVLIGNEGINETLYACGQCDNIIAADVNPEDYRDKLIKCPKCNALNELGFVIAP